MPESSINFDKVGAGALAFDLILHQAQELALIKISMLFFHIIKA